jgi:O-antigen ligase
MSGNQTKTFVVKGFQWSAMLMAFAIPFPRFGYVPVLLLLGVFWLLNKPWEVFAARLKSSYLFVLSLAFYSLHIIGLAYTTDMGDGLFDLEVKLGLLLYPLIWFTGPVSDSVFKKNVLFSFLTGMLVSVLILTVRALIRYPETGIASFFYGEFSWFHHTSYFALFVSFMIAVVLVLWFEVKDGMRYAWLYSTMLAIGIILIYLLSSKAGILSCSVVLGGFGILSLLKRKNLLRGLVFLLIAGFQLFVSLKYNNRFQSVTTAIETSDSNAVSEESSAARIHIFEATISLIKQHFLVGVGTGDTKPVLLEEYKRRGMTGALENRLNTHNQFFETWLGLGISGVLGLLMLFLIPFISAFRKTDTIVLLFLAATAFSFLFEAMLNTQAGVTFFAFFFGFVVTNLKNKIEQ